MRKSTIALLVLLLVTGTMLLVLPEKCTAKYINHDGNIGVTNYDNDVLVLGASGRYKVFFSADAGVYQVPGSDPVNFILWCR